MLSLIPGGIQPRYTQKGNTPCWVLTGKVWILCSAECVLKLVLINSKPLKLQIWRRRRVFFSCTENLILMARGSCFIWAAQEHFLTKLRATSQMSALCWLLLPLLLAALLRQSPPPSTSLSPLKREPELCANCAEVHLLCGQMGGKHRAVTHTFL